MAGRRTDHRGGTVRIIGGEWRGRRIRFPAAPGLRPTSDRRRETLFNWLAADLPGASCLDLFAGSGALGLEAASRGARRVVLVEASRDAAAALAVTRDMLDARVVEIRPTQVSRFLDRPAEAFDIVFVDPPFARPELVADACRRLAVGWLAPGARVYLELDARAPRPPVPAAWTLHRETSGGAAQGLLYTIG